LRKEHLDLPSLGIQDGDIAGRVGLVVQEGGQHSTRIKVVLVLPLRVAA